jgi:Cft2 family RNA processing exonuclease
LHRRAGSPPCLTPISTLNTPPLPFRFHRGLELPAHDFWLDPHERKACAFVSHAHSDHIARHGEIVATRSTCALMRARLGGKRVERVLEFSVPTVFRGAQVTLLPAGHVLGSAQIFVETGLGSLLYTGDFKLRPSLASEDTQWCQADTLIMETTFGRPRYVMPPTDTTLARVVSFCLEAHADGAVPVLLAYALGKAQEIICALHAAGLVPMLHASVWQMTRLYRDLWPGFPTTCIPFSAGEAAGKVVICPPGSQRTGAIATLPKIRTAVLTGWAIESSTRYRYQCDAAFPLTDHADYPDLLRYVELVQPRRVFTLHGFAAEFAADLRARGIEAWALTAENQLELPLMLPRPVA